MALSAFSVSSLHTSSVGFYSAFEYKLYTMDYANATLSFNEQAEKISFLSVSNLERVTPEWKRIHRELVESRQYQGLLVRSEEYWINRIPKEVQRLCGLQKLRKAFSPTPLSHETPFTYGCGFQWVDPINPARCAVFLSGQYDAEGEKLPVIKIREFFASTELLSDIPTLTLVFASFLSATIPLSWSKFEINCPGAIWRDFIFPLYGSHKLSTYHLDRLEFNSSDGIMYKSIDGTPIEPLNSKSHLFLALDSF